MNQNNRFCKVIGHEDLFVTHLCTVVNCRLQSRWNCSECLIQQLHKHDSNLNQVLAKKDMIKKFEQEQEQNQQKKIQILIKADEILSSIAILEEFIFNFNNQINKIKQQSKEEFDNYQQKLQQFIQECQSDMFYLLDEQKFQQLLTQIGMINQNQQNNFFDGFQNIQKYNQQDNFLNEFQNIQKYISLINDQQEKFHIMMNNNLIIDQKRSSYQSQQIYPTRNQKQNYQNNLFGLNQHNQQQYQQNHLIDNKEICYGCSKSNDEKYIAYGIQNHLLIIQNLKLNQSPQQQEDNQKIIKLPGGCSCCQFTNNSQQLFVGVSNGYINQYDSLNDFILLNQLKIHASDIFNIIPHDDFIITSSADTNIIKTNLINRQQIFELKGHDDHVFALQLYNQDILISGSGDHSIKFWNCNEKTILIDQKQAHNDSIIQIQLTNANRKLISLCRSGQVNIWMIDFINKSLSKVSQYYDINHIYNFSSVMDDQYLLFICNYYVLIIDQNGQIIKCIDHNAGPNSQNLDCKQLNNMQLILIRSQEKIIIEKIKKNG